jgi:pimeloyl-ACP methyl ester carboxylesterase
MALLDHVLEMQETPKITLVGLGIGASVALSLIHAKPMLHADTDSQSGPIKFSGLIGINFALPGSDSVKPERVIRDVDLRVDIARRIGNLKACADKACVRWFTQDARDSPEWSRVRKIVLNASVEGIALSKAAQVEAVSEPERSDFYYDGRKFLEELDCPALFVVGRDDGMMVEEMAEYSRLASRSITTSFCELERAGRLACCERPEDFTRIISTWINRSKVI